MTSHENSPEIRSRDRRRRVLLLAAAAGLAVGAGVLAFELQSSPSNPNTRPATASSNTARTPAVLDTYPAHQDITATMFWVGEPPDPDNHGITNVSSAWVDNWVKEFGGVDDPNNRCGYLPCGYNPKENAFYFALPFNDYDENGNLKPARILKLIPWYTGAPPEGQSLVKNRWIAVTFQGKTVYGQWEDVGPFGEDDQAYVFGKAAPKDPAGLDVSPAMNDYLNLDGEGVVSWHFINAANVPDGPWKNTVTTSGLNY